MKSSQFLGKSEDSLLYLFAVWISSNSSKEATLIRDTEPFTLITWTLDSRHWIFVALAVIDPLDADAHVADATLYMNRISEGFCSSISDPASSRQRISS